MVLAPRLRKSNMTAVAVIGYRVRGYNGCSTTIEVRFFLNIYYTGIYIL